MGQLQMTFESSESLLRHCENIELPEGLLVSVYIGPGGVFGIPEASADPKALFQSLRNLLETGKIRLYIPGSGYFDPIRGFVAALWNEETLSEEIYEWVFAEGSLWDESRIDMLARRLMIENSRSKRFYTDEQGNCYVLKSGSFRLASPQSSEAMFYLTLFGGVLGIHRFYSGKIFSGLIYLFTGGLMGIGWLLDVLCLFLGIQKDSRKRYYRPLKKPYLKLLALPAGIFVAASLFLIQVDVLLEVLGSFNAFLTDRLHNTPPGAAKYLEHNIENLLGNYFGGIAE